jgi:hypothetical protein
MSFAGISGQIGGQVTGGTLGQASASGRGSVSPGPRPRAHRAETRFHAAVCGERRA